MGITNAAAAARPFHSGGRTTLTRQPKVYGFDTGVVSFARGWDPLRPGDLRILSVTMTVDKIQERR